MDVSYQVKRDEESWLEQSEGFNHQEPWSGRSGKTAVDLRYFKHSAGLCFSSALVNCENAVNDQISLLCVLLKQ